MFWLTNRIAQFAYLRYDEIGRKWLPLFAHTNMKWWRKSLLQIHKPFYCIKNRRAVNI